MKFTVYPFTSRDVWGWGACGTDVLGASAATPSVAAPSPVSGVDGYTQVAIGGTTAYGIATDGTLWAWGKGQAGQLGDGSTTAATGTPVQVSGLANVSKVVSGGQGATGYALLGDGTVWAWGKGSSGQLGNGTTTATQSTPVQVSTLTGVTDIATGPTATYAVKSDGTVWAWGSGGAGQLGNGAKLNATSPVQVSGLTGMTEVAGAYQAGYALKSDGTVWAWGAGAAGQLGNGTTTAIQTTPVQVSGLTNVTDIAAGFANAYALNADGTVSAWGAGASGANGNGSLANATSPVDVSGLTHVTQIAGGDGQGYALDNNQQVWSWGLNTTASLGLGVVRAPGDPGGVDAAAGHRAAGDVDRGQPQRHHRAGHRPGLGGPTRRTCGPSPGRARRRPLRPRVRGAGPCPARWSTGPGRRAGWAGWAWWGVAPAALGPLAAGRGESR